MKKVIFLSLIVVFIDQLSKYLIVNNLSLNESYEIISAFFSFTYVQNTGAAFSLLQDSRYFLILVSLFALYVIMRYFIYERSLNKKETIVYAFLLGGIIGNLVDRIIHGYVIDFLAFRIGNYSFPIFNLADAFIVCTVFYLVIFIDWSKEYEN